MHNHDLFLFNYFFYFLFSRAPVITSSPSEDHTYSAGGSNAGSGASTPLTNGAIPLLTNGNSNGNIMVPNACDNQSNCASSDAAYESSEEK